MIFTRRFIQRCINDLSGFVAEPDLRVLVEKLNSQGLNRLPAMWEIVVLSALSKLGYIRYELELPNGKRPDIFFSRGRALLFMADITTVSDSGLEEANPVDRLRFEIEACRKRLGLPILGINIQVNSVKEATKKGPRTALLLPPYGEIPSFVAERIEPIIKQKMQAGEPLSLRIEEPGVDLEVSFVNSKFSSISHASFDLPESLTRNPLYNALDKKKRQVRSFEGVRGIIVCDGASRSLSRDAEGTRAFETEKILAEFLRQNSSIDFALVITVDEKRGGWLERNVERSLRYVLQCQPKLAVAETLDRVFEKMVHHMGKPKRSAINAVNQLAMPGFGWGHHGGSTMSGSKVKLSSRLLMEILSGRRSADEMNKLQRWRRISDPHDNLLTINPFDKWLEEGRLPKSAIVLHDADSDDDWIEITVSRNDAAVSVFKVPKEPTLLKRVMRLITRRR